MTPDALETDGPAGDAVETVTNYVNGFAIRFCEGPRPFLNFQAGVLITEPRDYRDPGMETPFRGHVSLFRVLGYGTTQDEAVAMAKQNESGRRRST
jgi:hypothetical protein